MNVQVKVTKDVIYQAKDCHTDEINGIYAHDNCPIALAIRDIMPKASVTNKIHTGYNALIDLPEIAMDFIREFDNSTLDQRLQMDGFSFTIIIPAEVIDQINIEDLYKSETLEVVG